MTTAWLRTIAIAALIALGAPLITTSAQDAGDEAKAGEQAQAPQSAREVFQAISNFAGKFGRQPTAEQNEQIWTEAWRLVGEYVSNHGDASDVMEVYEWANGRAAMGLKRDVFPGIAKSFLAKFPGHEDAKEWRVSFIASGLANEQYQKEAQAELDKVMAASKKNAEGAVMLAEVRLAQSMLANEGERKTAVEDAWKVPAAYLAANPKATDHATIYTWAEQNARGGRSTEGYLKIAKSYITKNPKADDLRNWRKNFIIGGLENDAFKKEATDAHNKLIQAAKKEAASATLLAELRMESAPPRDRTALEKANDEAWTELAAFVTANPTAKDLNEVYTWAESRAGQHTGRDGYLAIAAHYIRQNSKVSGAANWHRNFVLAGMKNDKYMAEASKLLDTVAEAGKSDARSAMFALEIRYTDAEARKAPDEMNSLAEEVRSNSLLGQSSEVWVRRDRARILLGASKAEIVNGKPFPCWSEVLPVYDLDGKEIKIADYRGKVVLLDFWAVWCGPCIGEMPNVVKAYEKFHSRGFEIIGLSFDRRGDEERLRETIKGEGAVGKRTGVMPWRQVFDGGFWGSGMARRYEVRGIPKAVLIDQEGNVVAQEGLRGEALHAQLEALLGSDARK